jgi:carboxymethylenebutenolidase
MQTHDVALGFLAHPEEEAPGVVLVPDVRGLYDHYRELARRLAGEGFAVLAVDLYRKSGPPKIESVEDAMRWIRELPDLDVLASLQEAVDFLVGLPEVDGRDVGCIGFCMGGQYALLAACTCRGLSACVSFYGMLAYEHGLDRGKKPRSPLDALPDLSCPVLGLYGAEDALIPVADVRRLERGLERARHPGQVVLYPGAGHAFMNDTRPDAFRPAAAADAWPRMVAFLRRHLA